jgi:hypothetical protein
MRKSLPVLAGHCRIGAGLTLLCGTPQGNQLTAPTAQPHCSDAESKITGRKVKRHELTKILCEEYGANSIEVDRVLDKPRRHPWLQACMPRRGVYFLEPALVGFDEELALINRAKRARPDRRGVIAVK